MSAWWWAIPAWIVLSVPLGILTGKWLRHSAATFPQPPGRATPRPVPGHTPGGGDGSPRPEGGTSAPPLPPGASHHRTGGVAYTVRTWRCGCVLMWDGQGRITGTYVCGQPGGGLDEELRRLTS